MGSHLWLRGSLKDDESSNKMMNEWEEENADSKETM